MSKVLLVEDTLSIVKGLEYTLKEEGFNVLVASSVCSAKKIIDEQKENINIAIIDVSLPDGDGFELCKYIKEKYSKIPVIFLTARDEETSVIMGLDMGADDYITKPFRIGELISRIKSVLRRSGSFNTNSNIIKIKNVSLDINKAEVYVENIKVELTALEYKILLLLFSNVNQIITREQILDKIWDMCGNFVNDNTLTVYIKRVREKIGDNESQNIIKTIRGMGYRVDN